MAKKWKSYPWPQAAEEEEEEIDVVGDAVGPSPSPAGPGPSPPCWGPSSPTAAATAPSPPPQSPLPSDTGRTILYHAGQYTLHVTLTWCLSIVRKTGKAGIHVPVFNLRHYSQNCLQCGWFVFTQQLIPHTWHESTRKVTLGELLPLSDNVGDLFTRRIFLTTTIWELKSATFIPDFRVEIITDILLVAIGYLEVLIK